MEPGVRVLSVQLDGAQVGGNCKPGFSTPPISLTERQPRLNIRRIRHSSALEIWNRLVEPLQPYVVESQKQIWHKQGRLQTDRSAERVNGVLVFTGLVVHQAQISSELGVFRMESCRLPVEIGSRFKIAPGLGVLRRGQERFKLIRL